MNLFFNDDDGKQKLKAVETIYDGQLDRQVLHEGKKGGKSRLAPHVIVAAH